MLAVDLVYIEFTVQVLLSCVCQYYTIIIMLIIIIQGLSLNLPDPKERKF